ncbi:type I restriction enzyme HsdR N-terminal domain-containing protein [Crocinitomicaceae bacterium CZZ-1]|uniref:Type I restriction enzyme HsdR N-terminal domain-containing protein n=1 Tax=Taishania pollutisoli TaxID=2766479 RepID=A0A8J6U0K8_9FLAO|nr:type I restriction endonuclease [Taishania pollutisoli]MBC9813358.1 type I restriction enzyme HsdR N-terminal domain-containing protein [Taishania pollutisoli]MBX2948874.1 type I restriction enzyme HsdR N-terminal domain-containing protein [Crocinitomicaceae bacterium]NGF75853.1 restriction endonuclease [Fluviicola sp. SGL-29]
MEADLKLKLEQLHQRVDSLKDQINTEEATKNAFIMPFIQILGYDIFNPTEVIPEFICDIGTKKGEKVDYVIKRDNEPILIIECKHWKENVDAHNSQLHRYFHVSKARFGVLTNGHIYNFYTDLERPNIMDEKPFFTLDLSNLKSSSIKILENFTKSDYNLENILDSAEALKYIKAIRNEFEKEIQEPSDEIIKLLVNRFFGKPLTASRMATFREYTKKAFANSINESISFRLKNALNINESIPSKSTEEIHPVDENNAEIPKFITTEEEIEGSQIIKAILREQLQASRIAFRDTQSYFGILLDDNNRKPICRLHFNSGNKYLELFNNGKDNGEKKLLQSIDDIYNYKVELLDTLKNYE